MIDAFKWLNPKNRAVRQAAIEYRQREGIPQWEPLKGDKLQIFEEEFARDYILQQRRQGYPFFLHPGHPEVAAAMAEFEAAHDIPHGCPWPDEIRDAFEADFAARRLGLPPAGEEWSWSEWLEEKGKGVVKREV